MLPAESMIVQLFAFLVVAAHAATHGVAVIRLDEERRLFRELFEDYEPAVRPRRDYRETVEVRIDFELNQMKELDEKQEILQTIGFVEAKWRDDYLSWDPANHSDIHEIVVPPERIWLPDFGIENSAETFYEDTYFDHFRVLVKNTGMTRWSFGGVFETSCDLDTTFYPFDFQTCSIKVENWAYSRRAVDLRNGSSRVHMASYHPHGIWTIADTESYTEDVYFDTDPETAFPRVFFKLKLQRKPRYYVVNIMIPCLFLTSIALLVYILPPESGEKVSLGVTILLSFSVFQFVIADNTPVNSDCTPLLSIFVAVTMGMSTLSVVTTVFVLHLHHHSSTVAVPYYIRLIFFRYISRLIGLQQHHSPVDKMAAENAKKDIGKVSEEAELKLLEKDDRNNQNNCRMTSHPSPCGDEELSKCDTVDGNLRHLRSGLDSVTSYVTLMTSRINDEDAALAMSEDWRALAKIVDRLLFYVTILCIIVLAFWVAIYSSDCLNLGGSASCTGERYHHQGLS